MADEIRVKLPKGAPDSAGTREKDPVTGRERRVIDLDNSSAADRAELEFWLPSLRKVLPPDAVRVDRPLQPPGPSGFARRPAGQGARPPARRRNP
jgi:hypothetical protein